MTGIAIRGGFLVMLPGDLLPVIGGMAQVTCRMIMSGRGYINMAAQAGGSGAFEYTRNVTFHALNGAMRPAQGIIGAGVLTAAGESFDAGSMPG